MNPYTRVPGMARFLMLSALFASTPLHSAITHKLLLADEGNAKLLLVDQDGGPEWTVPIAGNGRDLQLIGNNRVLVSSLAGGYFEYDLATGAVKKTVKGFGEVQSVRRLPDGHTLLAGNDLAGSQGVVVLDLDAADKQVGKVVLPGLTTFRLFRLTGDGHLLFGSNSSLIEADRQGRILWETLVADATLYKALRLRNGNLIVANWQNHGTGHGGEGIQLIEMDSLGALVWQYKQDPARITSLHSVIVLDGLDLRLGHDENDGVMAPWGASAVNSPLFRRHAVLAGRPKWSLRADGSGLPSFSPTGHGRVLPDGRRLPLE